MIDLTASQAGTGLGPDQRALQEALDRLLAASPPLETTRLFARSGGGAVKAAEAAFAAFGAPAMLVPEAFGGHGMGLLEAAIVARLLGQHASPLPFIGCDALAPRAIARGGDPAQHARWLPAIAAGECRLAVSLRPQAGLSWQGGALHGTARNVPDAPSCDAALLVDCHGQPFLVPAQAGLRWTALETVDVTRRFADAQLEHAEAEPLDFDAQAWRELSALDRLLLAADSLGACESLLDLAVAYAKERRQFGRPIGSFQAVKHLCADLAAELELARSLFWRAARSLDADTEDVALLCAQAKSLVDEASRAVARGAIEIHGAMGFTDASGLHFWTNRTVVNRSLREPPTQRRREIAALSGWLCPRTSLPNSTPTSFDTP
jgi:alkylation response protein AidB-like acyl-CoA dehydrogenase